MARKYLDTTGLTALWAKIKGLFNSLATVATTGSYNDLTNKPTVAEIDDSSTANNKAWSAYKIGTDLGEKVSKSGDTMTGNLTLAGQELHMATGSSSSDDSGDIVWYYGNGQEKARVWTADSPTTAGDGRLNFRCYKSDGTALSSGKLATASDVDGKANAVHTHTISQVSWPQAQNLKCTATAANQEYSIDLPSDQTGCYFHVWSGKNSKTILKCDNDSNDVAIENGKLIVNGTKGGSWVSSKDVNQASISVNDRATNGTRYDSIIAEKCYNNGVISIGRITNELHIGYCESGRTNNSLAKSLAFKPADNKVSFITDGAEKSYVRLSDGWYSGTAQNAITWNGVTDDHGTNNTTDTWVPVYIGSKIQHRVIPTTIAGTTEVTYTRNHASVSYTEHLRCWRFGNVITLGGYFSCSGSIAANTLLYTLPSPKFIIYFTAKHETQNRMYNFNLQTNGQLKTNEAIAGGNYLVCFTYVCA